MKSLKSQSIKQTLLQCPSHQCCRTFSCVLPRILCYLVYQMTLLTYPYFQTIVYDKIMYCKTGLLCQPVQVFRNLTLKYEKQPQRKTGHIKKRSMLLILLQTPYTYFSMSTFVSRLSSLTADSLTLLTAVFFLMNRVVKLKPIFFLEFLSFTFHSIYLLTY